MFSVLILHTEENYKIQNKLLSKGNSVELSRIPEKKLMASPKTLQRIEKKIKPSTGKITFLGKGDYHYITYLFLKKIDKPFTLIVFDNHLDSKPLFNGEFISCGSWINHALKLKHLEKAVVVMPTPEETGNSKLITLNYNPEKIREIAEQSENLYISIDKDILDKRYVNTNWDQGNFSPEMIYNLIKQIPPEKIMGIDVCGEPEDRDFFENKKSERINLAILREFSAPVRRRDIAS